MNAVTISTTRAVATATAARVNALAGKEVAKAIDFVGAADENTPALAPEWIVRAVPGRDHAFRNVLRAYSGVLNA